MNVETIIVGPFGVNCFLVWKDPCATIVVDPGGDADAIDSALSDHGLTPAAYLLTHGHVDHVSAVADLCERHPAPVALHAGDLSWAFGPLNRMLPFYDTPRRPPAVERELADGASYTDGGLVYRVLATPGHTPGSVSFIFDDDKVLFCGDTLFAGSVGRTDLQGGDSRALTDSLRRIAAVGDDFRVYSGHGPETTIRRERASNYFLSGF